MTSLTLPEQAGRLAPSRLEWLVTRLEQINVRAGQLAAWLSVCTVLVCFATVYLRYVLGIGLIWLQEAYVWFHVLTIMLGAGYTLAKDGFVRVSLCFQHFGARMQAWIDLLGTLLFLVPFIGLVAVYGWPFFVNAWRMNETSAYEGGLPMVWLLKGSLLVFALLMGIQAIVMCLSSLLTLQSLAGTHGKHRDGSP